jgi:hypothetical protein
MAIYIYTGLPGAGKTTEVAQVALSKLKTFEREKKQREKFNTALPRLFSNIRFSKHIEEKYSEYINYFTDINDLPKWTDSEIFIDEAAVYFDSRFFESLPVEIRRFLFTHRHLGTNLHLIAQDFKTVDNSFRRLTDTVYYVDKLLSSREPSPVRKPQKFPYNLASVRTVKKSHWELEKEHYVYTTSKLRLFTRKHFDIFDTRQELPRQPLPPLRKEVRICPEDNYTRTRYI